MAHLPFLKTITLPDIFLLAVNSQNLFNFTFDGSRQLDALKYNFDGTLVENSAFAIPTPARWAQTPPITTQTQIIVYHQFGNTAINQSFQFHDISDPTQVTNTPTPFIFSTRYWAFSGTHFYVFGKQSAFDTLFVVFELNLDGTYTTTNNRGEPLVHLLPTALGRSSRAMALLNNNFYFVDNTDTIKALDLSLVSVSAENIQKTGRNYNVLVSDGQRLYASAILDTEVDIFGPDFPAPVQPIISPPQYQLSGNYEERFDVIRGTSDLEIIALNVPGKRSSALSRDTLDPGTAITTQATKLTVVLKTPLDTIDIDDFIIVHTGEPDAEPDALPATGRYQVKGISTAGPNRKQELYCEEITV